MRPRGAVAGLTQAVVGVRPRGGARVLSQTPKAKAMRRARERRRLGLPVPPRKGTVTGTPAVEVPMPRNADGSVAVDHEWNRYEGPQMGAGVQMPWEG
jgi:hypothetical protein